MKTNKSYLVSYPTYWPIFSTKFYSKDSDGWWNPIKRNTKKRETNAISSLLKQESELYLVH